jgi:hypothetical protein
VPLGLTSLGANSASGQGVLASPRQPLSVALFRTISMEASSFLSQGLFHFTPELSTCFLGVSRSFLSMFDSFFAFLAKVLSFVRQNQGILFFFFLVFHRFVFTILFVLTSFTGCFVLNPSFPRFTFFSFLTVSSPTKTFSSRAFRRSSPAIYSLPKMLLAIPNFVCSLRKPLEVLRKL